MNEKLLITHRNKKDATTFQLVFRSQDDPRIHDADASDMVFTEKTDLNHNKIKQRDDLEEEFGPAVRDNEGEAANYGIYYDDTEYDYMQHMRDLGTSTESHFFEAPVKTKKGKVKLEDALKDLDIKSESGVSHASSVVSTAQSMFSEDLLPSEFVRRRNYQDQQDVPDEIAGFQPDMDPRLREVLEALEDEAYVDDDEDIFEALAGDAEEVDADEWEETFWEGQDGEDEGWESDRTVKAENSKPYDVDLNDEGGVPLPQSDLPDDTHGDGDWMAQFSKFKQDAKSTPAQKRLDLQSTVLTGASSLASGRKKKRKGALTSASGYSMSSSVLARTEGQTILDARFDKIEEEYADDEGNDDSASMFSGMSGMTGMSKASSQAPQLVRSDFDSIMGEFLQNHSQVGKRRVRVGKPSTGLEQLDEIRKGLGPARIKTSLR
jgi:protein LTV1